MFVMCSTRSTWTARGRSSSASSRRCSARSTCGRSMPRRAAACSTTLTTTATAPLASRTSPSRCTRTWRSTSPARRTRRSPPRRTATTGCRWWPASTAAAHAQAARGAPGGSLRSPEFPGTVAALLQVAVGVPRGSRWTRALSWGSCRRRLGTVRATARAAGRCGTAPSPRRTAAGSRPPGAAACGPGTAARRGSPATRGSTATRVLLRRQGPRGPWSPRRRPTATCSTASAAPGSTPRRRRQTPSAAPRFTRSSGTRRPARPAPAAAPAVPRCPRTAGAWGARRRRRWAAAIASRRCS
mmetsp:Transcript_121697/g.330600  ORF Transcript_121697/g.330600 Transcript_121697/m.330600 type:complete len:299 (-) Transcript_121697:444-1340(-)